TAALPPSSGKEDAAPPLEAALDRDAVDRRNVEAAMFDEGDRAAVAQAGPDGSVEEAAAAAEVEHVEVHGQTEHVLVLDVAERVDRPFVILADLEQADVGLVEAPVEPATHRPVAVGNVVAQVDLAAGVVVRAEGPVERGQRIGERGILDPAVGGDLGTLPAERIEVESGVQGSAVERGGTGDVAARFEPAGHGDGVDEMLDPAALEAHR